MCNHEAFHQLGSLHNKKAPLNTGRVRPRIENSQMARTPYNNFPMATAVSLMRLEKPHSLSGRTELSQDHVDFPHENGQLFSRDLPDDMFVKYVVAMS
jgi:hypothetical protein